MAAYATPTHLLRRTQAFGYLAAGFVRCCKNWSTMRSSTRSPWQLWTLPAQPKAPAFMPEQAFMPFSMSQRSSQSEGTSRPFGAVSTSGAPESHPFCLASSPLLWGRVSALSPCGSATVRCGRPRWVSGGPPLRRHVLSVMLLLLWAGMSWRKGKHSQCFR